MNIVDPAHVLALLQIVSALTGYSIPTNPPPQVIELTSAEINTEACKAKVDTKCDNVAGLYGDGDKKLFIDSEWTNSDSSMGSEDSYIIHELTHWVQYEHGFGGNKCPRLAAREREAYRVQREYIEQYEHKITTITMPRTCGFEGN